MRIPGQPALGSPDFARWLNGSITRFCGKGYHEGGDPRSLLCKGTISTLGIECPCLCKCHADRQGEQPDAILTYTDPAGGPDWEPRSDER